MVEASRRFVTNCNWIDPRIRGTNSSVADGGRELSVMTKTTYTPLQKALHWLVAAMIVLQWWTSAAVLRTHAPHALGHRPSSYDLALHQMHVYGGLGVFALVCWRLYLRWKHGAPPRPATLPAWEGSLARIAHGLLYFVLIGLVVSGFVTTYFWFGMNSVHRVLVYGLYLLVTLHVSAVVAADIWLGAGSWRRMAHSGPGRSRGASGGDV